MRSFTDEHGDAWVAATREENSPRHHGRWYLVFFPENEPDRLIGMPEVRWQTRQLQRLPVKPCARSTSKRTAPQWQDPAYVVVSSLMAAEYRLSERRAAPEGHGARSTGGRSARGRSRRAGARPGRGPGRSR